MILTVAFCSFAHMPKNSST